MFGRKTGLLAAVTMAMMLFGGCGNAGANLGRTVDGNKTYTGYGTGTYSSGGTAYWDGYGINNGMSYNGTGYNGSNYTTYGTRTDGTNAGTALGQDLRNTWDDLTGQNRVTTNNRTNTTNTTNTTTNRTVK